VVMKKEKVKVKIPAKEEESYDSDFTISRAITGVILDTLRWFDLLPCPIITDPVFKLWYYLHITFAHQKRNTHLCMYTLAEITNT